VQLLLPFGPHLISVDVKSYVRVQIHCPIWGDIHKHCPK
jgi:hypothetical protein